MRAEELEIGDEIINLKTGYILKYVRKSYGDTYIFTRPNDYEGNADFLSEGDLIDYEFINE